MNRIFVYFGLTFVFTFIGSIFISCSPEKAEKASPDIPVNSPDANIEIFSNSSGGLWGENGPFPRVTRCRMGR